MFVGNILIKNSWFRTCVGQTRRKLRGNTLPRYVGVDDVLLIGVDHQAKFKRSSQRYYRFRREIRSSDHLLMEGSATVVAINDEHRRNFEAEARRLYTGTVYYLEERTNLPVLATRLGVESDAFFSYDIFRSFHTLHTGSFADFERNIRRHWKNKSDLCSGYFGLDVDHLVETVTLAIGELDRVFPDDFVERVLLVGRAFGSFLRRARDVEYILPSLKSYSSELEGKKAVIVGGGHVDFLATHLQTEEDPVHVPWHDYVAGLETRVSEAINFLENEFFTEA